VPFVHGAYPKTHPTFVLGRDRRRKTLTTNPLDRPTSRSPWPFTPSTVLLIPINRFPPTATRTILRSPQPTSVSPLLRSASARHGLLPRSGLPRWPAAGWLPGPATTIPPARIRIASALPVRTFSKLFGVGKADLLRQQGYSGYGAPQAPPSPQPPYGQNRPPSHSTQPPYNGGYNVSGMYLVPGRRDAEPE
jgi:hypothetical protein